MHKLIKSSQLLFFTILISLATNLHAIPSKFNDVTILVSSCDKYAVLWEPFFVSLFKQWPSLLQQNREMPIILVANQQRYEHPRVQTINIINETSWSENIQQALQKVRTPYVLVLLDDYWLNQPVDEVRLQELLTEMRAGKTAFIQTSVNDLRYQNGTKHIHISNAVSRNKFAHYKVSLQAGLWNKEALQFLLRPGESAWNFEIAGSMRAHGYPQDFVSLVSNEPIHYINASHLGHITPEAFAFVASNGIKFDAQNFPRLSKFNWRIIKRVWSERWDKAKAFVQDPGLFYKMG